MVKNRNIAVIGTGYVGLVAGACLADMGNNVICVDNDINKLNMLRSGDIPIYEPGLEELVLANLAEKRLVFSDDLSMAVKKSSVCFIAVGTPQDDNGAADLTNVFKVAEDIAKSMNGYKVIVDKSTVPVGTADKIKTLIASITEQSFDIVSNPEFLRQGNAVDDFLNPDRVIIGSDSDKARKIMENIYAPFLRNGSPLINMDIKSAEMTKYTANAFLATKISFMNEIANLCEKVGADIEMVRQGISSDSRIGNQFLFPGLGFGGSCFPKDIKAIVKTGEEFGCDMNIINEVDKTNQRQRFSFVEKISKFYNDNLTDKIFGVWGLAFKPKTNDMREAPSVTIIKALLEKGAKIKAFDPKAMDTARLYFDNKIEYSENSYEALRDTDGMLLLTEWNEFLRPDFDKIKELLKNPVIFDGRNQYDKEFLEAKGFKYFGIGK